MYINNFGGLEGFKKDEEQPIKSPDLLMELSPEFQKIPNAKSLEELNNILSSLPEGTEVFGNLDSFNDEKILGIIIPYTEKEMKDTDLAHQMFNPGGEWNPDQDRAKYHSCEFIFIPPQTLESRTKMGYGVSYKGKEGVTEGYVPWKDLLSSLN